MVDTSLLIPVVLSTCFLQVHCPPGLPATTPSTDHLPYVTSEEENESCFYKQKPSPNGYCNPGYHRLNDDSFTPCSLCPHNETIQTFQSQKNTCEKCILCTNCTEHGLEVAANCTRTTDTVCTDASSENFGSPTPTDSVVVQSPSPSTPTLDDGLSSTTSPLLQQRNKTDPPSNQHVQVEHTPNQWMLIAVKTVLFIITVFLLVCFGCYKRKTYKSRISVLETQVANLTSELETQVANLTSSNNQQRVSSQEQDNLDGSANHETAENGFQDDNANCGNNGIEVNDNTSVNRPTESDDGPTSAQPLLSAETAV